MKNESLMRKTGITLSEYYKSKNHQNRTFMNHFATSIGHLINSIVIEKKRKSVNLLIFLAICFLPVSHSFAQIPNCSANVPTYNIDFTGNPAGTFSTPNVTREGNCCSTTSPDRCIHFAITFDPQNVAVNFEVTSGSLSPGALFYQVDCGAMAQVGTTSCIFGSGVHHLTFCKPGNNVNTYRITAIPKPIVPSSDTVRIGCSKNITTLGYQATTVTWNSIFPGAPGTYNSYLSCNTGCANPLFTPQAGSPAFIDYVVCGEPIASGCGLALSVCDTVRVYVYPELTVSINPNPASFCPTSSGVTLSALVSGGFGTYSYVWKKSGTTVGTAATYFAATVGTYTVDVKDGLTTCPTVSAAIQVSITNISLTPSRTNVSCNGGSNGTATVVATGGTLPYTYVWSPNVGTTATVTGLTAQSYSVTVTDAGGCSRDTTIVVGQPSVLVAVIDSIRNVVCNGQATGALYVSVTGGTPPYSYHWSSGQTTRNITGVPAGYYTDTIIDSKGCIAIVSDSVRQPAVIVTLPTSGSINGNDLSCYGSNDGTASVIVVGGTPPYSYIWSSSITDTTASVTGLAAGPLSVLITDANGCTLGASTIINQPDSITSAAIADSVYFGGYNVTCFGDTNAFASLVVNGGTTPYTFLWSNGDTTSNLTSVAAGVYVVTITDANGCIKIDSIELTEPDTLLNGVTSPITAGGFNIACKGQSSGSMDLTIIGGTPPFVIAWSTGDSNTTHLTNLFAGFYSVNIIDINGCTAMDTITLTEPDTLVPLITATVVFGGSNVLCFGGSMDSATVIVTGGTAPFTFLWSPTNDTTQTIYNVFSDTISVLVVDTNGCSGSDEYFVTQPAPIQSSVHASLYNGGFNVSCFGASDGYAVVVNSGGTPPYSYSWSNAASTDSIFNLMAGNYVITITDSNGCAKLDSILLTEPTLLVVSPTAGIYPSGDNISCNGASDGTINTIVTGGAAPYSYLWSSSPTDTLSSNSGLLAGTYSVTVTDDNGCRAVDSVDLMQPTPLLIDSLYSPVYPGGWNVSCNGGDDGSIYSSASGGSPPYAFSWTNGDTLQNIFNVSVDVYIDTVIDINGCRTTASITLTEPPPIISTPSIITPVGCTGDSSGSITISTTGGTVPYQYSIDGIVFSSSNTFNNLPAGTYVIHTADTNSCADSIVVVIVEPAYALNSSLVSQTNVNCFGNATGSLSVSTTGGTRPYLFSIGGPFQPDSTFSNLVDGPYSITVRDSNNCTTNVFATISQPSAALDVSILLQTNVDCYNLSTGSVVISVSGGTPQYQYSIGGPFQSSNVFTNLTSGSYLVTVRDTNNCIDTVSVNITQPSSALSGSISALFNVDCHGTATGSITVTASGGTAPYLYSLNGGPFGSNFTFNNLFAGSDTITISDNNDCIAIVDTIITEPSIALAASVAALINVDCYGNGNGSFTVSASGGTPSYQYSINGGVTWVNNPTFSNLSGGSYFVDVRDLNGCVTQTSTTITEPADTLHVSVVANIGVECFGNATGILSVTASGGRLPYLFSIGSGFQSSNTFPNLVAGPYIVTVVDSNNNCIAQVLTSISQPIGALVANPGQNASVCGSSTNLTATLNSGITGIWSTTGIGSGSFADPMNPTTTVTGLSLGNNTFQWHVSSGNCKDSALVTIIQDAVVLADGGDDADTCENQSSHFILQGIQPAIGSGLWTVVPSSSGTVQDPTSHNSIYTPSASPSINVLIWTVMNGSCIDRDTLILSYFKGGECFTELDLPSAFSPNLDSHNDAYVIHGIELYPENLFIVFNRWGNEVYSKDNYRNLGSDDADWRGQNKNGNELPDGTYFVVLTIPKSDIVRTTYVDIRR